MRGAVAIRGDTASQAAITAACRSLRPCDCSRNWHLQPDDVVPAGCDAEAATLGPSLHLSAETAWAILSEARVRERAVLESIDFLGMARRALVEDHSGDGGFGGLRVCRIHNHP